MKRGLVFSGGGSRGSYQVGVWKALDELNIKCDIAVGTSIGSVNAALYTQNSLDLAIKLWQKININTVFKEDKLSLRMTPSNFKDILSNIIDYSKIIDSNINYGLVTCKFPKIKKLEIDKTKLSSENIVDYLIASCTVYPVFKATKIDKKRYVDGGFREPIPINLAKKLGADELIIVNISALKPNYKPKDNINCIYIKHYGKLKSPLKFDSETAKRNLIYGYNDTMKVYNKYYGKKYTFKENYDEIKILEFIGKYFDIDDTKVYTKKQFNKIIVSNNYTIEKYGKKKSLSYKANEYIEKIKSVC